MLKFFISGFFLLAFFSAKSQLPVLGWVKTFEENNVNNYTVYNNGRTVGVDQQGNVYSAGLFEHTVDFDPGPATYPLTGEGPFEYGMYISKLDANGNFVWAKQIPTYTEFGSIEIKVDANGNIYMASDLFNTADMDPGPGVLIMSPTGFRDAFVVKLNTDGNLVWAKQFGGPGDTGPQANMVELDKNNNVIIGGIFNNTVDFDPGPGVLNITSTAHMQAYIVKLNNNDGSLIWAKQFGNGPEVYSGCSINDIKCDGQNNIVLTGSFQRTCDFDPGVAVYNVTSSPGSAADGFICKLDANSNFIWVKTFGQNGANNYYMTPTGIDIDGMNNIITTGFFIGNFDFDPGPGTNIIYANPHDCYILKLDQQGNFIWVRIIGSDESETGHDVVVDAANNVYTIGSFGTSVDFDPGPDTYIINSSYYGASALVKLTSGGDFIYAAPFQSISYGSAYLRRMIIDPAENIYITGTASGIVDFDPGPNTYPIDVSSSSAPLVFKLSRCVNRTTSALNISDCNSYTLNDQTYDSSGTYIQTISNSSGCDSIITLHLVLNKKLNTQTKIICQGESFYAGGTAQTISGTYTDSLQTTLGCDSIVITYLTVNPKPLPNLGPDKDLCSNTQLTVTPGAFTSYLWQDMTAQNNFIISAAGTYWVTVTNNYNCTATDSLVINTILPPSNFLKEKDSICSYDKLSLKPSTDFNNYMWSTGNTQNNITITSPGQYWLRGTDVKGCVGIDTITIYPKQCMIGVYIPNAFTPNGDGKNDTFKANVFGQIKSFKLQIFDRLGALIFQTENPDKEWNGLYKGNSYTTATFVWQCFYQLENEQPAYKKGTLLLLR